MFVTTENEIKSLMPTARWNQPQQLFGYIDEEERVALEPLLGTALYQWLLLEYDRLREAYVDITATTVRPTGQARQDPRLAYVDVTERLEQIHSGNYRKAYTQSVEGDVDVPANDMMTIQLIRICQRIEFYKMLSHKAGLLAVSFNAGGGMNVSSADGYEPASKEDREEMRKDAFMAAGRAIDDLLMFLEADVKGKRLFAEKWKEADAFYLHKDLLFQTAKVLNEYLPLKGGRMDYVELVRDIRFCQNTYLKPRIGGKLLRAVLDYANEGVEATGHEQSVTTTQSSDHFEELLGMVRTALAFYVESRRVEVGMKQEKLARRDSMTDAQQEMAMACQYIESNLDAFGESAVDTPIYNAIRAREKQEQRDREDAQAASERRRRAVCEQNSRKLFTGFPATHRTPEYK